MQLILSILGFTHIVSGEILYDGVDIRTLPRNTLRQAIATIPQEAALFQGTIAFNIDPIGTIPESRLQKALDVCLSVLEITSGPHNSPSTAKAERVADVGNTPLSLHTQVDTGGKNFSHGQR